MSPGEIAAVIKVRLAVELQEDRASLERLARAIDSLRAPVDDARGEWMRVLALAFEVERYYTAAESVLMRILRTIDGEVPQGSTWHLDLLRAALAAIPSGRPALITPDAARELRELLKFRHLARHGYSEEPNAVLMDEHAARVGRAHGAFLTSLDTLDGWLRAS